MSHHPQTIRRRARVVPGTAELRRTALRERQASRTNRQSAESLSAILTIQICSRLLVGDSSTRPGGCRPSLAQLASFSARSGRAALDQKRAGVHFPEKLQAGIHRQAFDRRLAGATCVLVAVLFRQNTQSHSRMSSSDEVCPDRVRCLSTHDVFPAPFRTLLGSTFGQRLICM